MKSKPKASTKQPKPELQRVFGTVLTNHPSLSLQRREALGVFSQVALRKIAKAAGTPSCKYKAGTLAALAEAPVIVAVEVRVKPAK